MKKYVNNCSQSLHYERKFLLKSDTSLFFIESINRAPSLRPLREEKNNFPVMLRC